MSWTDFFPVFDDQQIIDYESLVSPDERAELDHWCGVDKIFNPQTSVHLVAVSLFWKNLDSDEPDLHVTGREQMQSAAKLGLISRWPPWEHYVLPLLEGAKLLQANCKNAVLRVYLAADLDFLVEDLIEVGCEVFLMRSSSIRHNPGALWRFLALQDTGRWVTILDSDRADKLLSDIERTEQLMTADLGLWRLPYFLKQEDHLHDPAYYRPIYASQFGARGGQKIEQLLKAFIWHNLRGTMATAWSNPAEIERIGGMPMATTTWPDYGFDEWFLLAALYPRIAFEGVLTFFHSANPKLSICHALDIEYVSWASPRSEVFICPEKSLGHDSANWDGQKKALVVRQDATVIQRERPKYGAAHGILNESPAPEIAEFKKFKGSFKELISWAESHVVTCWWIDLNPRLKLGNFGGELFCDLRYTSADVVVCGWQFIVINYEIAQWAAERGFTDSKWREHGILKLPKIDGPGTLWRTSFSKEFYHEWQNSHPFLPPEVMLQAWIEHGRAHVLSTTARQMGWKVR